VIRYDPTLELCDRNGTNFVFDDNWKAPQENEIEAAGRSPTNDREPAIQRTLAAGSCTVNRLRWNTMTGVASAETCNLDSAGNAPLQRRSK
jgi:hypothetical protein